MPTVEVTSTPLRASARLRVAMRVTRCLADHGSDPAHVIVVFRAADPMTYFAGGVPLTRYGDDGSDQEPAPARWASVVCHIHPDRDHACMSEVANEIRAALGLTADSAHCLVRFEPVDPSRVFYAESGRLTNSVSGLVGARK